MIKLAPIFQNHMVIQANKPILIFGYTESNTEIDIDILGKNYTFSINTGDFTVELKAIPITK